MSEIKSYENMPVMTVLRIFRDVFLKLKLQEVAADLKSGKSLVESLNDFGKAVEIVAKVYEYANSSKVSGQKSLIEKLGDLGDLLECTTEALNDFIDLVDGIANNTKTKGELAKAGTSIASNIVEAVDAIKSISGGSSIILPVSALIIKAIAENFATIDGIKYEDLQKVASALVDINIELGKGIAEKLYPDNARLSADLGPVALGFSALSGIITGATDCMATIEEYKANGIPEDIAWHDGIVILITSALKETATKYTNGADDVLFKWLRGFASWVTKTEINYEDKDYMELWAEAFKKLNVYNTGDDNDNLLIAQSIDNHTEIYGKGGNDAISNFASYVTIWGGNDNDTIFSHSDWKGQECVENSLLGGMGDDVIITYATLDSLYGGKGEDLLAIYGNKNTAYGEEGKDKIAVYGNNNWVFSGTDDDILILDGVASGNKIYGDEGNDTIAAFENANSNTINGGAGNDRIMISNTKNQVIQYISGDGDDEIIGYDESDTITISGSSYKTSVSGQDVIITVGNGSIKLYGTKGKKIHINRDVVDTGDGTSTPKTEDLIIYPGFWSPSNIIRGTAGNDEFVNLENNIIINVLTGNDRIYNRYKEVTIYGGSGNDYIKNGEYVDYVGNSYYWYNNYIQSGYYSYNGYYFGTELSIETEDSFIDGGADNDTIINLGNHTTINGGDGDDDIYNGDNTSYYVTIRGSSYSTTIKANYSFINGGAGNDHIRNDGGDNITIYGGDGDDWITSSGERITINGGNGNDWLRCYEGDMVTIEGGAGNDTILSFGDNITINGEYGDDYIDMGNSVALIQYSYGDGNDTITYIDSNDTLRITGSTYSTIENANDIIVKVGTGSITIKDGKRKNFNIDGTLSTGEDTVSTVETAKNITNTKSNTIISGTKYADTILNNGDSVSISGGAGNDSIIGSATKVTIDGGDGADYIYSSGTNHTVIGGKGNDLINLATSAHYTNIKYSSGDGNDIIYGLDSDDTLQITGAEYTTVKSGSDLIIGVGNNSISVVGGANVAFKINGTLKGNIDGGISVKNSIVTAAKTFAGKEINLADYDATKVNATEVTQAISIIGTAAANSIKGGKGADTITGGAGSDTIVNLYGSNAKIYGGDGDDYIHSESSNDTINGGSGNDYIKLDTFDSKNSFLIYSNGDGDDTVYGFMYDDTLQIVGASYMTLESGDDVIVSVGNGSIKLVGNRNRKLNIQGTLSADTVTTVESAKNIQVTNSNTVVSGTKYNDTITNGNAIMTKPSGSNNVTINSGAGRDSINNGGKWVSINAGSGDDKIDNCGSNATILGGDDNDEIINWYGILSIVDGGNGNDTLTNMFVNNSIYGGEGNDKIINGVLEAGSSLYYGHYSLLDGGTGNDYISNQCKNVTITGGNGNDDIVNWDGGNKVTINGGMGNDTILNIGQNAYLDGGNGNDYIENSGSIVISSSEVHIGGNSTLIGGGGDDYIYLIPESKNNIIQYGIGDGNDTILGINESDTIKITGGKYTTVKSGNDVKINIGSGSILVKDGTSVAFKIDGTLDGGNSLPNCWNYGNSAKTIIKATVSSAANVNLTQSYGDNVEKVDASKITGGKNIVGNSKANSIKGGKGADTISGGSGNDTVSLGGGNDVYIYSGGNDVITDYTAGQDKIKISSGSITSASLSGSNVVLKTSSGSITVKSGKGKKLTIIDANGNSTTNIYPVDNGISVKGATVTASSKFTSTKIDLKDYSGATKLNASAVSQSLNIVGNSSNNSIKGGKSADTISGDSGKDTILGGTGNDKLYGGNDNDLLKGESGNDTIYGNSGNDSLYGGEGTDKLYGDVGNDKLYGDAGNDSLYGGNGNDTLTGGAGNDIFIYEGGNDIITDYTAGQDKIKISSGNIDSASLSGSDVVLKIGTGSIKIKSAKNKKITVIDSSGSYTIENSYSTDTVKASVFTNGNDYYSNETPNTVLNALAGNDSIYNYADDVIINGGAGKDYLVSFSESKAVTIKGDDGNDTIYSWAGKSYIDGGKGDDYLYLSSANNYNNTLIGGSGNDTIYGSAGDDSIFGDSGNDKLVGSEGDDSIIGGSGNDTLTGNTGKDVFIYSGGKDVIIDYTASDDKIKIQSGTISKTSISGQNVVFTIGSGSLTVKDGKYKKITIIDSNGKIITKTYDSGVNSRTLDLLYDNNFMTDELQIDDVSEVSLDNYSVGQVEYSTDSGKIGDIDTLVLTTNFEKK